MEQQTQGSDRLKEVAMLLKQADKLVKEGDLVSALELIVKARSYDSRHLYALAYEERIRTLLNSKQQAQAQAKSDSAPPVQASAVEAEPSKVAPETLQHLSNLAIIEAQHSAVVAAQQEKAIELQKKEEEERTRQEELRKKAIEQKINAFLQRATTYFTKKEYNRALDEIARAYLLDPVNENIHTLEDKIRKAQEDARKEEEEERQRRLYEEKQKRDEVLKSHAVNLQREREEKLKREEQDKKRAQEQKVQQYLQRVNELYLNNKLEEALSELAFVIVIDPLNEEVLKLEQKIIETQERRQQEQLDAYQKQLEERQRKRHAIQATIQKHIENAEILARQNKFSDALRTITRATVLDPVNDQLQECERKILQMQEEFLRQEEEKRKQIQEQIRKQQEEELLRIERANRDRVLVSEQQEADAKNKADKEKINKYLDRAQNFLEQNQFEVALGEVALAFIVNPFDEEVKKVEQKILAAREGFNAKKLSEQQISAASEDDERKMTEAKIQAHMHQAEQYRMAKDYSRAFNEVAKAFILNPMNEDIQKYENELQEEFDIYLAEQHAIREREERERQNRIHIERATELLERELFEEALNEIATGLTLDETNAEMLALRDTIQASYRKWQLKTLDEARNMEVQRHFLRAREFYTIEKYNEALDEVQKALTIDPYRSEVLALKLEIETKASVRTTEVKKDQLSIHIANAEKYITSEQFDKAIIEIVSGLIIDPSNSHLISLEKKVISQRTQIISNNSSAVSFDVIPEEQKKMVNIHLRVAEEYKRNNEFSKALDEIMQAYALDPLNTDAALLEATIRKEQEMIDQQNNRSLKLVYKAS